MPCVGCGRLLFVLPASSWPQVRSVETAAPAPLSSVGPWRAPLLAAGATALVVAVIFALVLVLTRESVDPVSGASAVILARWESGQKAFTEGKFRIASQELQAAQNLLGTAPEALSPVERRKLKQILRQASLLSDLTSESLADMLRLASETMILEPREWEAQFKERFQGKAVLFDDEVRRESDGAYRLLGLPFFVRDKPARLELAEIQLLRALPLDQPQRLFFGARLAEVKVDAVGTWTVRFEPESGVLVTDLGAATACCPVPAEELREVIDRQATWAASLP